MVPSFSGMVTHETNGEPRNRQVPPEKPDIPLVLDDSAVGASSYAATGPIRPTNRPWESGVPARVSARAGLSVSWAGDAQQGQSPGGVAGVCGAADVVQRLDAAVAAVAGMVGDGDLASGQGSQLVVRRGLVGLDEQQVGGVLDGDQPPGVLALGVQCVGGHHLSGKVQAAQQRPEPGDLVGHATGVAGGCWSASHWPRTRSSVSGSTWASTRRTVA